MGVSHPSLPPITLGSSSPRRRALLKQIGVDFKIVVPEIDEEPLPDESAEDYVRRMALEKAQDVLRRDDSRPVLASDTTVVLEGSILGKPQTASEAISMLQRLSGVTHTVLTSWELISGPRSSERFSGVGRADVRFRELDQDEISRYVASGSPMDKAGAYGIQEDLGAVFVESIVGDYYTIVGLPLSQVYLALRTLADREDLGE